MHQQTSLEFSYIKQKWIEKFLKIAAIVYAMEGNTIQLLLVPVRLHMWKQGGSYVAIVIDDAAKRYLSKFLNHTVTLNIEDMVTLKVRLIQIKQGNRQYLAMYLPKSLQPTWEELKARDDIYSLIEIELTEDAPPRSQGHSNTVMPRDPRTPRLL